MHTTIVTFENRGFSSEDTATTPRGRDAAEFVMAELRQRGIEATYYDIADFYAHSIHCRVGCCRSCLTIGFVGDDMLMIDVDDWWLPRFLRFVGLRSDAEGLHLLQALDSVLRENGFRDIKWWTRNEWRDARREWATSPA